MKKRIGIGVLTVTLLFTLTACNQDRKEYKAAIDALEQQKKKGRNAPQAKPTFICPPFL